jgi:hypothetical protein
LCHLVGQPEHAAGANDEPVLVYMMLQVMYDANMQQLLPKITCSALMVVGERDFRWDPVAVLHAVHL